MSRFTTSSSSITSWMSQVSKFGRDGWNLMRAAWNVSGNKANGTTATANLAGNTNLLMSRSAYQPFLVEQARQSNAVAWGMALSIISDAYTRIRSVSAALRSSGACCQSHKYHCSKPPRRPNALVSRGRMESRGVLRGVRVPMLRFCIRVAGSEWVIRADRLPI